MTEIDVYYMETCSFCKTLKKILEKHQVPYHEHVDIMKIYPSHPTILVDGEIVDPMSFIKKVRTGLL